MPCSGLPENMHPFRYSVLVFKRILSLSIAAVLLTSCSQNSDSKAVESVMPSPAASKSTAVTPLEPVSIGGVTASGQLGSEPIVEISKSATAATKLLVVDQVVGSGDAVKASSTVLAHYIGVGLISGQKFDSSWDRGQPIQFGLDQVIPGWTQGLTGMKIGGRRLLVIPGALAYGATPPAGSGIEPNETLVFVVDLVDFQ
jgi:peptidylprolyl isomerase